MDNSTSDTTGYPSSDRAGEDGGKDKRAALRASMKQALQSRSHRTGAADSMPVLAKRAVAAPALAKGVQSGGASSSAARPPSDKEDVRPATVEVRTTELEDPWLEVHLAPSRFGIEDCRRRAEELQRRGDFDGAARMWRKLIYLARRITPPLPLQDIARFVRLQCEVLLLLEKWDELEAACRETGSFNAIASPADLARLALCQGRSKAELRHDVSGAKEDIADALSKLAACDGESQQDVKERVEDLEGRLLEMEAASENAAREAAASAARCAEAVAVASAAVAAKRAALGGVSESLPTAAAERDSKKEDASSASKSSVSKRSADPAERNQAMVDRLDRKYAAACAADGWDEIQREATQPGLTGSGRNLGELRKVEAATRKAVAEELARQAAGRGEEVTFRLDAKAKPKAKKKINLNSISDSESSAGGEECEGDIDIDIKKLEVATMRALNSSAKCKTTPVSSSPPIRTKSDVVRIDTLSDSESDEEERNACKKAETCVNVLEEFERLGREKEQILSKWRDRWGS